MKMNCLGNCISDSTLLKVYQYKREKQHRIFKGMATKSYSTMGGTLDLNFI